MMKRYAAALGAMVLLCACGVTPIEQDQPVYLAQGQGLAAVVTDTLDPITQVTVESTGGGTKLDIPSVPAGTNIYLFPVPAGHYCFTRFQYGRWHFFAKQQGDLGCFEVQAGQLGYSGTLAPRVVDGQVFTNQVQALDAFRELLRQRYPTVAKQFLPAQTGAPSAASIATALASEDPEEGAAGAVDLAKLQPRKPPEAGKDQISSWAEQIGDTRSQAVFLRNNTGWSLQVVNFELYDCAGVKQACGVQKGKILLPPHATQAAFQIDPADPHGAYAYRTRFIYGFVQNPDPPPAPKKKKH